MVQQYFWYFGDVFASKRTNDIRLESMYYLCEKNVFTHTNEWTLGNCFLRSWKVFPQIQIMKKLMDLKLDCQYIVRFFGWFTLVSLNKCVLMFEMLDMNLEQYCDRFSPLPLIEIKTAIIQVWTRWSLSINLFYLHTQSWVCMWF